VWPRTGFIAAAGGAGYGLLALEAVSPLAVILIMWVAGLLIVTWRLPTTARVLLASAAGFIVGFGVVWTVVFTREMAACRPPSCTAADPTTDIFYALAFLLPVVTLAAALLGLKVTLLKRSR
jgi:hypothetical protein